MARKCKISNKGVMSGNKRSHAMNASRRKWKPNLQKVVLTINNKKKRIKISARALRTIRNKNKKIIIS